MKNGVVYMLYAEEYPKVYIGSTINPISKRLANHRQFLRNTCKSKTLFENGKTVKYKILHAQQVENRSELFNKEREYIEKYKEYCLNKNIPMRTSKEYYQDNKEHLRVYHRNKYEPKKNGGDGKYTQLMNYHSKKSEILRRMALKNASLRGRPPTKTTMLKHNITEADLQELKIPGY